jgi:hypothetical protein
LKEQVQPQVECRTYITGLSKKHPSHFFKLFNKKFKSTGKKVIII